MRYQRFDPPAFLTDFTSEQQRDAWSQEVSRYFEEGVAFNRGFSGVTSQFYNPVRTETQDPFEEPLIDWPGFPRIIKNKHPSNPTGAWREAEAGANSRASLLDANNMDEYLEWHVVRDSAGKITRVSFTCETLQYYTFLALTDQGKLLALYKDLVDPTHKNAVKIGDLISPQGRYRPFNRWNTEHGAIHLIQTNNNLYAEVQIAAQACILRRRSDETVISDSNELIECSRYGEPGRASDPKIGAIVNQKAREGHSISLRNPVALYITSWRTSSAWKKPDGSPVGNYWRLVRGQPAPGPNKPAMGLHLVFEVPAEEGFVVGDIKVGNRTIGFGGELAEQVSVGLFALTSREGETQNPAFECGVFPSSVTDSENQPAAVANVADTVADIAYLEDEKPALRSKTYR